MYQNSKFIVIKYIFCPKPNENTSVVTITFNLSWDLKCSTDTWLISFSETNIVLESSRHSLDKIWEYLSSAIEEKEIKSWLCVLTMERVSLPLFIETQRFSHFSYLIKDKLFEKKGRTRKWQNLIWFLYK